MPVDLRTWLHDIVKASRLIGQFVDGLSYEQYQDDVLRSSAVERQLGIVGEAVAQVLKVEPQAPLGAARQIVGFRNILIHNYARVSNAVVWTVIHDHLPVLSAEAQAWLEQLNRETTKE
ncbi:uncharacterized protein with HEPN domain [Deinococcus sp. HSC-46F16]|uniref:HepT-like ribonuclease domain-containing protein n=1 Tax=Deinococcus sp. HSC-46F16 TaxID=2910968 RepID=UPI00209F5F35|nr:HepT-like ribonuclease domain-containing protein [Deinococcus sp. HSC-46F16]MCP2015927.1 uncharacterized protein with HEPN domain [Deinococcus sp. HSC-46F16]